MPRLNKFQKRCGVLLRLYDEKMPLTAHTMALKMGYQNGVPLREIMAELLEEGMVEMDVVDHPLRPAKYYFLTKSGRELVQSELDDKS